MKKILFLVGFVLLLSGCCMSPTGQCEPSDEAYNEKVEKKKSGCVEGRYTDDGYECIE